MDQENNHKDLKKHFEKSVGQLILSAVLITDVVSLIALGFILKPVSKFSS